MSDDGPLYPCRVSVRETMPDGEEHWKSLCIVYDAEAMGLLERLLTSAGITHKIVRCC